MSRLRFFRPVGVVIGIAILLAGCARNWVRDESGFGASEQRERSIPSVPLGQPAPSAPPGADGTEAAPGASLAALLAEGNARVVPVGLDGFRASLLQNNLQLRVSRFAPEIAASRLGAEYGRLDATLSATVVAVQEVEDASDNNRPTEALDSRYLGGEAGLSVPLATGGSVDLKADLYSYKTAYLEGSKQVDPSERAFPSNLSAKVTVPLLDGAGYDPTLGPIAVAAFDARISVADLRNMLATLLSSSEQVYWQLVRSWRALEIQSQMLALAEQTVADIEALASAGVVPAFQRYRADYTVNQRRASLLRADLDLRRDMRSVKILMNRPDVPLDADVIVRPESEPTVRALVFDRARLAELAMENRSELMRAELELRRDELSLRMARQAILPDLDLTGSIGVLGIEEDAGSSIESLLDGEFPPSWSVGLSFDMPLGNHKARGDLRAARLSRTRTETRSRELRLQVLQEVYDAVDQLEIVWAEILAQRGAEDDAVRNLEGVRELLRTGSSSAMEVALAIGDLADAKLAVLTSEIRYQVAMIELARATGTALGRHSIEVLPATGDDS